MQAAFLRSCWVALLGFNFPPPAPRAGWLTKFNCTGAGCAADAGKPVGMQAIYWDVVILNKCPHLRLGPICKRVVLG